MINLNKDLPTSLDRDFREALNTNFEKIEQAINNPSAQLSPEEIGEKIKENNDEMYREIRAIITPDMSPLEVTEQVEQAKTDSKNVKHATLSERIAAETAYSQNSNELNQLLNITDSGHISVDFIKKSNLLSAKKIAILGDSVAHGLRAQYNFGDILKERTGAEVINLSVSGVNMSNNGNNNIYQQALKTSGNDVVIVQGTDDDWCNSIDVGTDEKDITKFYGGFYQVIQQLRMRNKGCKIIVVTATRQAKISNGKIVRRDTDKNKLGLTLADYVDAQKEACTLLSVPYADMFYTDLFDPYNPAFRKMCMSEGLHPNEIGHQIIFQEICRNYFYYYG
ncbi:SGNH/GDSL hydrolase family protein [Bacillus velezensis]|nr:SGNH/GDSL hydrolase family protein [Bacillus velezensis]WFQ88137.1 SGNH/GDSL hydrolase family protein [Bacillus velezensis]